MMRSSSRRIFISQAGSLLAGAHFANGWALAAESAPDSATEFAIATTAAGRVRGSVTGGIRVFKGIPYGASTAGHNRFLPPKMPTPWTGVRDALTWGASAPQTVPPATSRQVAESEDCLVLNVFTPALGGKRPVMVWLHGGGWANGSGSSPNTEGANLARASDVVVVSINHRLNIFGFADLAEAMGPDFESAGAVGLLDILAALQWIRGNIDRFGGDPYRVTVFGQSGGGRKVATLMSMPAAKGLFHRGIIESGAVLRLTERADASRHTAQLLAELSLKPGQIRALQSVSAEQLLTANAKALEKWTVREPGWAANTPAVDGTILPGHPWDPHGPALSADIPLMIGWAHTEETNWERPTPERLALDAAGLQTRVEQRLNALATDYEGGKVIMTGRRADYVDPKPVIDAFRQDNPAASPYDLYVLIASEHPRGTYSRELARRKAEQRAALVYVYRFDWETPEGGGMRSPHAVEIPFVFRNIAIAGKLISQRPDAYALADTISASWAAFARNGTPQVPQLPFWPAYSAARRDTLLFNSDSRVVQDPDHEARVAMEHVLKLA
jgi:para-nitrobenzyl esterase